MQAVVVAVRLVRLNVEGAGRNVEQAGARRKKTDDSCNCVGQSATHDSCLGAEAKLRILVLLI